MSFPILGTVRTSTPDGSLIVAAPAGLRVRLPGSGGKDGLRIGAGVMDARQQYVGRVVDIIGAVASPHLVIKAAQGAPIHRLLGADVFLDERAAPRGPPKRDYRGGGNRGPPRGPQRGPPRGGRPQSDSHSRHRGD